jgi:hypothetical protein
MQPAEPPSPPAGQGVAAVRLADRRLVFVEGVPSDLPIGAVLRLQLDGAEVSGEVSIPPPLLVWRDPDAHCAAFVAVELLPTAPGSVTADPPLALFRAGSSAPDEAVVSAMLRLAREESSRLDSYRG